MKRAARTVLPPQEGDDIKTYSWVELNEAKGKAKLMSCGPCGLIRPASVWAGKAARRMDTPSLLSHANSTGHRLSMARVHHKWEPTSKFRVVVSQIGKKWALARLNTSISSDTSGSKSAQHENAVVTVSGPEPLPMSAVQLLHEDVKEATQCVEADGPSLSGAGLVEIFASAVAKDNTDDCAETLTGTPIEISSCGVVCSNALTEWAVEGDLETRSPFARSADTA
jgi:hypothetical protein